MIESKSNKELERKIDLYVNGRLKEDEVDELWAELIQDEYYMDYMKSVANLKSVIDAKKDQSSSASISPLQKAIRYGAAAAVILIASVIGVLNMNTSGELSVSPVEKIGLDVVRDAEGIASSVTNEVIRRAIRMATEGEVQQAITILEDELEQVSGDPQLTAELALSLGSIQYNNGNYEASVTNFEKVVSQNNIDLLTLEKGYWFLGNTYFQLDRLEDAETAFRNAYELNGAYSRVSKTYMDALGKVAMASD
jgi:tetratricopeptide (TPR) repeat protein